MKEENTERLKDWKFKVDEISPNAYKVWGSDSMGRSVERVGADPEELLAECKADALKISSEAGPR